MKKITILVLALATYAQINAQNNQGDWCATMQNEQKIAQQHPEYLEHYNNLVQLINSKRDSVRQAMQSSQETTEITIPIVFHIIMDDDWSGNISDAQVADAVAVINRDYNELNPDTAQAVSIFKPYIANCQIQFRLARIDPNGNCTKGITRNNSSLTNNATDAVKSVIDWDPSKYLNIWVVKSIAAGGGPGIVLGYAQFPGFGAWSTYGVVVRNDYIGTIGTSASDGRTLTHEIGHCFGLLHTFQSGCGSNCSTSGDQVCDTPPADQSYFGCDSTENTCSNDASGPSPFSSDVVDQINNYMSYNSCTNMFTDDQNVRMHSAIASDSHLQSLTSNSNLIATGTNTGYTPQLCKPIADFSWNDNMICQGSTVNYTDQSYNAPVTTWNWTFQGGSPANSTDSNVTVTYNTAGTFSTTLNVSNSTGSNSKTKTGIIFVSSSTAEYNNWQYYDSFENATQFGNDWIVINPDGTDQWTRTTNAAATGSASIMLNNLTQGSDGEVDEIISPSYDFAAVNQPTLTFKIADAQKTTSNADMLRVYLSTDCGKNWQLRYAKSGSTLATAPASSSYFLPTSSQWRTETVIIPGTYFTQQNIRIKFQFTSAGGNNMYIDDINIQSATGIEKQAIDDNSFKIYPNPTQNVAHISFNLLKETQNVSLTLTDMLGKKVATIFDNTTLQKGEQSVKLDLKSLHLPKGVYFIRLKTDKTKTLVKKLIID